MWTAAYHRTARQDILSLSNLPAKRDKSCSSSRSGNQGLTCFPLPAFGNLLFQNTKRFEWKWVNLFGKRPYIFFLLLSFYYWTIVWIITQTETFFCLLSVLFFILVFPLCFTPSLISVLISQHPPCLYFYHCKFNNHLLHIQEFLAEFSIRVIIIRYIKFL